MRCVAIDDQRVDAQRAQARRDGEARLAAADHEHGGIAILIGLRLHTLVEPVVAAEVAAVTLGIAQLARPSVGPAVQFLERGEQRPGLPRAAVFDETHDGVGMTERGLELEDRLDAVDAGPLHAARWRARVGNHHIPRGGARQHRRQRRRDRRSPGMGDDVPGEGQHVAPVPVGHEGRGDGSRVLRLERRRKLIEPARCNFPCIVLGFVQGLGKLYGHPRYSR